MDSSYSARTNPPMLGQAGSLDFFPRVRRQSKVSHAAVTDGAGLVRLALARTAGGTPGCVRAVAGGLFACVEHDLKPRVATRLEATAQGFDDRRSHGGSGLTGGHPAS